MQAGRRTAAWRIARSRRMQRALDAPGMPVRTLHIDSEGHGVRRLDRLRRGCAQLPEFLSGHLCGATGR